VPDTGRNQKLRYKFKWSDTQEMDDSQIKPQKIDNISKRKRGILIAGLIKIHSLYLSLLDLSILILIRFQFYLIKFMAVDYFSLPNNVRSLALATTFLLWGYLFGYIPNLFNFNDIVVHNMDFSSLFFGFFKIMSLIWYILSSFFATDLIRSYMGEEYWKKSVFEGIVCGLFITWLFYIFFKAAISIDQSKRSIVLLLMILLLIMLGSLWLIWSIFTVFSNIHVSMSEIRNFSFKKLLEYILRIAILVLSITASIMTLLNHPNIFVK
jgi:hypothetical protein